MRGTHDLSDLQEHLFAELDALRNPDLKGEELKLEMQRAQAVTNVAKAAIENANVAIKAIYVSDGFVKTESRLPKMLES